jgi:hypothetical protein
MRWQRRIGWEGSSYWPKAARGHVVIGYKEGLNGVKWRLKGGLDVWDMSVETYLVNEVLRALVEGKVVEGGPKDGQLLCNDGPASLRISVTTAHRQIIAGTRTAPVFQC